MHRSPSRPSTPWSRRGLSARALSATFALALGLALGLAPAGAAAQTGYTADQVRSVRSAGGVVVSANRWASEAGREVLAAGGNAVDAAVATAFALAVTDPRAGNIGGGGFMLIRFPDGRSTAIDFRERAPLGARPDMFERDGRYDEELHHEGHRSVGVPGTVAGLDKAHRLHGSVPWERLVYPAVRLAEEGYPLTEEQAADLAGLVARAQRRGYAATVSAFSRDGTPYRAGETHRQPELGRTLERIMLERSNGFYRGETARLLADEMRRNGGLISEADLILYMARERAPVQGLYRGYEVISMPPPSAGGVGLVQMLNVLEGFDLASMGHNSSQYVHHLVETMRRVFLDRATFLADPDVVDVPVQRLLSREHAADVRAEIAPDRASYSSPSQVVGRGESRETTHFSVVDRNGMAVAVTYTLEGSFGSGITVPGAGFLLNNEMGDFNAAPGLTDEQGRIGTSPNLARPGQRMLSSMTPTILARNGSLVAVLGTPGGRTIPNTVLQLVLNLVDFEMGPEEAVAAPRVHHAWLPDVIEIEPGIAAGAVGTLQGMGHRVRDGGSQGLANIVVVNPATGERVGVPDPRSPDATAAVH